MQSDANTVKWNAGNEVAKQILHAMVKVNK